MAAGGKRRVIESITVQEFLERHGDNLELSTEHPVTGLNRVIEEPRSPCARLTAMQRRHQALNVILLFHTALQRDPVRMCGQLEGLGAHARDLLPRRGGV